jgi:hypothetical protein
LLPAAGVAFIMCGIALAVVRGPQHTVLFAIAFGIGQCANLGRLGRSPRVQCAVLSVIAAVFLMFCIGQMIATSTATPEAVVTLVLQTFVLAIAYALVFEHAHGVARLSALFATRDRGYAPILDKASAGGAVEAELARSRRHGTPLTFVLFVIGVAPRASELSDAVGRVSTQAIRELEAVLVRERLSQLISRQARRSDLIVCLSADHHLVVCADTGEAGAAVFAERIMKTSCEQLGLALRIGVAGYPTHGTTYTELIAAARVAVDRQAGGNGAARGPSLGRALVGAAASVGTADEAARRVG